MSSIDLASAMKGSDSKRFTTRPLRIAIWSFAAGYLAAVLSLGVDLGDLSSVFDRLRHGVEAVQEPPATTQAPVTP